MADISRRKALGLMAAATIPSVGIVAIASAHPAEKRVDLQTWLDNAEPNWVAQYHAARLAEVMETINPSRTWRFHIDHEHGFALVCGDSRLECVQ